MWAAAACAIRCGARRGGAVARCRDSMMLPPRTMLLLFAALYSQTGDSSSPHPPAPPPQASIGAVPAVAIVLTSPDASLGEQFAARELSLLLGNISNGRRPLPVYNVSDVPMGAPAIRIAVGWSASTLLGVPTASLQGLGRDGFRISVAGGPNNTLPRGCVAVTASRTDPRGALYGVYELVGRMGLEFLAWDMTVLPLGAPTAPLVLPNADIVDRPAFMYRDVGEWPAYSNRVFARHMRFNNADWLECVEDTANSACLGGQKWDSFEWASPPGMAHTIYHLLCANGTSMNPNGACDDPLKPPQDLIKSHPEWFWPHGDADTHHLCVISIPTGILT
eukprot:COSAG01_NODE_2222_length_8137_cov_49.268972_8_plen_335_part_00